MLYRLLVLALCATLVGGGAYAAGTKVPMLDSGGAEQGAAKLNLAKGLIGVKVVLAPLPATIDTGTGQFEATIYKAYLLSSTDPAIEIPLGSVYPNAKSKAVAKGALKGDLTALGLDRVVIVAFSKDGVDAFDVLTGTIAVQ